MHDGKWVEPRYTNKEIFEKDYPKLDLSGVEVKSLALPAPPTPRYIPLTGWAVAMTPNSCGGGGVRNLGRTSE